MLRPSATLRHAHWLLLVLGASLASQAEARVRWSTPGSYRLRTTAIGETPLDADGTDTGQRLMGRHRLRIDPTLAAGTVDFRIQIDVLTGQIYGDPQPVGAAYVERRAGDPQDNRDGWTTVEPRMLWAEWRNRWLTVRAGQMGDAWGMGLTAADGRDDPDDVDRWVERFGDRWNGDLVQRAEITFKPLGPWTLSRLGDIELALGVDQVYQDEEANFLDGDRGRRITGKLYYPGEEWTAGVYINRRFQDEVDGDRLDLWVVDGFFRWLTPLYPLNADLRVQGQFVFTEGETNRFRPAESPEEVDLDGIAWALRTEIAWRCPRVATGFEVGYASGDADPDDAEVRRITLDPDYRVGFILFRDVLRLITLRSAERLADLERVGQAPSGVEHLPTDGAVRNAWYFFPGVTWRPGPWRLTATALLAWAAVPFVDPVASFDRGGVPTNPFDQEAGRYYGLELNGSAHYTLSVRAPGQVALGVQGGLFLPGAALDGAIGPEPLGKLMARLDLRW